MLELDGWEFLAALFRNFPTVSHDTHALYDAPGRKFEEGYSCLFDSGLDFKPQN